MTISSQLTAVNSAKTAIKTAIEGKGVTVGNIPFSQYAGKIDSITGGGSINDPDPTPWTKPADWLDFATFDEGQQGWSILVAVMPYEGFVGFTINTNYTVDWGDGSALETKTTGASTHTYDYNSLPAQTGDRVYRQAVIKITVTGASANPTFNFGSTAKPNTTNSSNSLYLMAKGVGIKNTSTIRFSDTQAVPRLLEYVSITGVGGLYMSSCFKDAVSLYQVDISGSSISRFDSAFNGCFSLVAVNAAAGFTPVSSAYTSSAFMNCYKLVRAPAFMKPGTLVTLLDTFNNCYSLVSSPSINIDNISNIQNMFSGCSSLQKVNFVGTSSQITSFSGLFNGCKSLVEAPQLDYSAVLSTASMFYGSGITSIYDLTLPAATTINQMFSGCANLVSAPNISAPVATNAANLFSNCTGLREANTLYSFPNVTTAGAMFTNCSTAVSIAGVDLPKATTVADMFSSCSLLKTEPTLNAPLATTTNSAFYNCFSIKSIRKLSLPSTTVIANLAYGMTSVLYADLTTIGQSSAIPTNSTILSSCSSLTAILTGPKYTGIKASINLSGSSVMGSAFLTMLEGLGNLTNAQTLTLTSSSVALESPVISKASSTMTAGSRNVTVPNTTSLTVGTYCTGANMCANTAISVDASGVFTWTGNNLTDGDIVSFTVRPGTALPLNTIVYVVNATANTFQVSATPGGSPLTSTAGTCTLQFLNSITAINGTALTLKYPLQAGGSATLVFRNIPVQTAVMRGWTVTG